jgi:hypothetical protein
MSSYLTQYGELKAISTFTTYSDSQLKDCVVNERADLPTPLGLLTPKYEHTGIRCKHIYSVSFFQNGKISRIALNEQTEVETPIGKLPAELITFYESGSIKRLFPLNGQISGYWSEDDEYNLSKEFLFQFPFGSFEIKFIGIHFYENGSIQSLTLWPKETISVQTPLLEQKIRIGLSLYPDGIIKSFEPADLINVVTPIGAINSFDITANGITGDKNSLSFTEDGKIKSLTTSNTKITVMDGNNITKIHSPIHIGEIDEFDLFFKPLKIDFGNDKVRFNEQDEYKIRGNQFKIEPYHKPLQNKCSDCSNCKGKCL